MNYNELKAEYLKNLKLGLAISIAVHLFLIAIGLLVKGSAPQEVENGYKEKVTYFDLRQNNLSPSIAPEQNGGGGRSARISGVPVPVKKVKDEMELDNIAPAKGDSAKNGKGGAGTGSGTGGGAGAIPPVDVFKKSDYLIAVEMQPEPFGGYAAIDKKVIYPEQARKNSITGKVFLQVYINENGEVVFAEILKGLGYGCDEAALKAIKITRFKAGKLKGRYVKVQMSVPINFQM